MTTEQQIKELYEKIEQLKRRTFQEQIPPDVIKMRHIGEGVRYIRDGGTNEIPEEGEEPAQGAPLYFDYEANILYIWNRSEHAWKSTTLT